MLRKVRIEVEEDTPEAVVEALTKYEHAIQTAEAERFGLGYTHDAFMVPPHMWGTPVRDRAFYNERIGRELVEEVIEYDPGIAGDHGGVGAGAVRPHGYRGRRVVRFTRIDTRTERPLPADDVLEAARARGRDQAVTQ